jgi:LmbE family N-acetylglucosaminyl deacetylase
MRIASIHAHPDDAEILAGGTLALLAQAGHVITIVTMTPGDKGSDILGPEEIAAVRRVEAMTAAAMIGADYLCAEFRDMEIFSDDASRRRVVELVRQLRADIVIAAAPSDYLADHEAASVLVRDALFAAQLPNYRTDSPPLTEIPALYFMDPIEGLDRDGRAVSRDFAVDIGETFEIKKAMLAAHATQRDWLKRHHGMDNYLISMETWTRERGRTSGCTYAEGFRQYTGHPYPRTPHLQALLAEHIRNTSAV